MTFTKNFKWQMVLVALGASLILTGKVYSQEIDNTNFAVPASSSGDNFNTNTNAPAAVNTAAANPQEVYTPATGAAIRVTNEMGELGASSFPLMAGPLVAVAIIALGCFIVKKVSASMRNDRNTRWNAHTARQTPLVSRKPQVVLHS